MKRLFLFAFYDPQGVVGETVLRYLEALGRCGDIIVSTDCDLAPAEVGKLRKLAAVCPAAHHGEYDFGSYKRAFARADLDGYDVLYLVNDSVVGPLYPLEPYLERMEALGTDAFGLALHPSRNGRHLQSWFIGLRPAVFRAPWFRSFLDSVSPLGSKEEVCVRYETGLTRLLEAHDIRYAALYELRGKSVYNAVARLFRKGFPFLKRSAFTRHGGSLGPAVAEVLSKAEPAMAEAVVADMDRLYGEPYRRKFLSDNRLQSAVRYLRYLFRKFTDR